MDIGSLLVGLALLAVVAFIVAQPFIEQQGVREKRVTETEALVAERELVLDALRDLDFDHTTGKITTEDYTPQREQLVVRGVALLKRLDSAGLGGAPTSAAAPANGAGGHLEDEIERAVSARRKSHVGREPSPRGTPPGSSTEAQIEAAVAARRGARSAGPAPTGRACPRCGAPAAANDRFCAKCGTALPEKSAACSECGHPLQPDDRFCGRCGAKAPDAAAAGTA